MTRILLVEDDRGVRQLVEQVLLDAGYEVDVADTVAGGRDLLGHHAYDMVLADGSLGDGTGMMVGEKAQEMGIPTLIITGYAPSLPRDELARHDFLPKPIRPRELLEAIERVLLGAG